MHCTLDKILVIAPVLHDIDLAAKGPGGSTKALQVPVSTILIDIFAQHPDCGPGSCAFRQFGANLNLTVCEGKFRIQPGRSVLLCNPLVCKSFLLSHNMQDTITDIRIVRPVGIMLYLTIIPAVAIG